ncbi:MAG: family 16 glycoside hydrolase [Verrucomicrobiota bacterium]
MRPLLCVLLGLLLAQPVVAQEPDALNALVEVLKQTDDPQFQLDVLKGMNDGLKGRRNVPMPAGWDEVATRLAKSPNPSVRELAQSLSLTFGSTSALASLRAQLADAKAPVVARRSALDSLLAAKDPQLAPVLQQLLSDAALRGAALRGLAAYDDAKTPELILALYLKLNAAEKRDALNTLVSRAAFARPLLAAVARGAVPAKDLSADIVRQLGGLRQKDIDEQVAKLWGVTRATPDEKKQEIARYKKLLQTKGRDNPMHGRAVYARTCQQCHALFDAGGKIGPDITGSNRADLDYILHNILDPNAEIPNDYRPFVIETKDDRVLTGIIKEQNQQTLTVATANETLTLPRSDVQSIQQSELSMMPEGLLATLKENEVRDLIAYLAAPAQVPMLATPDNASSFFNGKDLDGWDGDFALWKVENGEIVGRSQGLKKNEFLKGPLAFGDFRLVVKVKLTPNEGNSGIQFRSEAEPGGSVKGFQADVGVGWWGKLYEEHGRGLMWKESGEKHVKLNDWNTYEILAVGSRVRTAINGNLCVDLEDTASARQGIIAFQLHSGAVPFEVRYKDFQFELNPEFELVTLKK